MYPEAETYLQNMVFMAKRLEELNPSFTICPCVWTGKAIKANFIEGESLTQKIEDAWEQRNVVQLNKWLDMYRNSLLSLGVTKINPSQNESFAGLFGECDQIFFCIPIAHLDYTPDNILYIPERGLTNIDIEWVFDFPVPVDFVIFRGIRNVCMQRLDPEAYRYMLAYFEIEPFEILYELWEHKLSEYVYEPGGLSGIHARYRKPIQRLYQLPDHQIHGAPELSRIYVNEGNGYQEASSFLIVTCVNQPFDIEISLKDNSNIQSIRFDPCEGKLCYVKIDRAQYQNAKGVWHSIAVNSHNGWDWQDGFVFASLDPWVEFQLQEPDTITSIHLTGIWRPILPEDVEKDLILSKLAYYELQRQEQPIVEILTFLLRWQQELYEKWQSKAIHVLQTKMVEREQLLKEEQEQVSSLNKQKCQYIERIRDNEEQLAMLQRQNEQLVEACKYEQQRVIYLEQHRSILGKGCNWVFNKFKRLYHEIRGPK